MPCPREDVPRVTGLASAMQGNSHHVDVSFPSSGDRAWAEQVNMEMVWKSRQRAGVHSVLGPECLAKESG